MLSLIFNNKQLPAWLKVTNIKEPIGQFDKKQITIEGYFMKKHLLELSKKIELNSFMEGGKKGYGRLILPSNKTVHYIARVKQFSNTSQNYSKEKWSMIFELENEFIINNSEKKIILTDSRELVNAGTVEVYPKVKFEVTSTCEIIQLADDKGKEIIIKGNFRQGQVISFNQETFKVELDGALEMSILQLNSKRLKLKVGLNRWTLKQGNVKVHISWQEKFI